MRGDDRGPEAMFNYVSAGQRVPTDHPLRTIRALVDDVLRDMSREFDAVYARVGRPSIPPGRLLRAQLLQVVRFAASAVDGAAGRQPAVPVVSAWTWTDLAEYAGDYIESMRGTVGELGL